MLSSVQIKDLNRGAFGMVVLARDKQTGELFALKFIERGPQVRHIAFSTVQVPRQFAFCHLWM